jgi:shikimate kinase
MAAILIIGMRGCGKTSVGEAVARGLGARFVDLDAEVLAREGYGSVASMWESEGQAAFREAETRTLESLLDDAGSAGAVIALGGGAPTAPGAAGVIGEARNDGRALVVYLRCSLETLESRLRATLALDANRPSVTGGDPVRELGELLRAREPVYRALCDAEVDGESGGVEEVARRVREAIGMS